MPFTEKEQGYLLQLAKGVIAAELGLAVEPLDPPESLHNRLAATFVTLTIDGQLRGCIGSLQAQRSLLDDISHNARAAAFSDPRFLPLTPAEFSHLDLEISVLSELQPLSVASEEELLRTLRPGVDGLLIQDKHYRATFLPSVWEQLPQPHNFLDHLRAKAGMPAGYWSDTLQCEIYQVEKLGL